MQNNVCSDIFCYGDTLLHVWGKIVFKILYTWNTWKIVRRWDHQLTHVHIHIDCSRNVSKKITEFQNFISSLFFNTIYIKFSLFYSNFHSLYWLNLNPDRIFPLVIHLLKKLTKGKKNRVITHSHFCKLWSPPFIYRMIFSWSLYLSFWL